jgi:F420-dependent oxidoreductase-like protein
MQIPGRSAGMTAMTAATLDLMSGGRFLLGLGLSGPQVAEGWHGQRWGPPLQRTREYVEIVRRMLRREVVDFHGDVYELPLSGDGTTGLGIPLKMMLRPLRPEIPVYLAAIGPRNVALAAEIADGWLPIFYLPEKVNEVWGADLAAGAAKRPPELGPLEVVAGGLLAVGDDAAALRDLARPMLALYVGGMGARGRNFYNDLARRFGFEAEAEKIQDLYLDGQKDEAAAAVPPGLLEAATICGPEGYVRERLAGYKDTGVTVLNVTPLGADVPALVGRLKEWIGD